MITDDMVNTAMLESERVAYETGDEHHAMRAALTAAYPLIRAQVIEECAKVINYESAFMNKAGMESAHRFVQKIREMK